MNIITQFKHLKVSTWGDTFELKLWFKTHKQHDSLVKMTKSVQLGTDPLQRVVLQIEPLYVCEIKHNDIITQCTIFAWYVFTSSYWRWKTYMRKLLVNILTTDWMTWPWMIRVNIDCQKAWKRSTHYSVTHWLPTKGLCSKRQI